MSLLALGMSIAAILLAALAWVFWLILRDAMNKEAAAVIPQRTRNLIERAKNRLPEEARPRWEEEWPAGFAEAIEKRPVWALQEAVSLYRCAGKIAAELEPAVASASGHKGMARPVMTFGNGGTIAKLIARLRAWPDASPIRTFNRILEAAFRVIERAVEAMLKPLTALTNSPFFGTTRTAALAVALISALLTLISQLLKL